ncbi:MAG: outer membrane protein assembly factor BamD [Thermoanaerobaculia bacterium]|nr:outer membrane protein assembly factor BamD [Thermoanaerobaculia bacterium]
MRRMARRFWSLPIPVLLLALLSGSVGCGSAPREDPVLRLSAEESLAEGKRLLAEEEYQEARKYLEHAFEVEPNSVAGREALLLAADALYLAGGNQNLIQAEAKYRDFLNRFPTSDRAAYAQYQIGNALFERMEKPDRDQTRTHEALEAFRELIRVYPANEHATKAEEKIDEIRARLAEHEFYVAHFYFRYGLPRATVSRLNYLLENYPEYPQLDEVYYYLGRAHARMGDQEEATDWFDRLREEYPGSELLAEIPDDEMPGDETDESSEEDAR